jgi:hypothetical protein
MSDKIIKFVSSRRVLEEYWPKPIASSMPQWWKDMPAYGGYAGAKPGEKKMGGDATYNSTIKRCVPVADSLSLGYVIVTDQDIYANIAPPKNPDDPNENGTVSFSWRGGVAHDKVVEGHTFGQAKEHPLAKQFKNRDVQKWINPWRIETPSGYSTLFVPPMNNPNGFFTALPGVVDTDKYTNMVNFPFIMNDEKFEGIIPAGTPVVQVIPFKRDSWKMVSGPMDDETNEKYMRTDLKFRTLISSAYKRLFWQKKEFK